MWFYIPYIVLFTLEFNFRSEIQTKILLPHLVDSKLSHKEIQKPWKRAQSPAKCFIMFELKKNTFLRLSNNKGNIHKKTSCFSEESAQSCPDFEGVLKGA